MSTKCDDMPETIVDPAVEAAWPGVMSLQGSIVACIPHMLHWESVSQAVDNLGKNVIAWECVIWGSD